MDAATVQRQFSVVLEKTVRELQGVPCIELDVGPAPKQQIMYGRSFGEAVTRGRDLVEAVRIFKPCGSEVAEPTRRSRRRPCFHPNQPVPPG